MIVMMPPVTELVSTSAIRIARASQPKTSIMLAESRVVAPILVFNMFRSCRILASIGNAVMENAIPTNKEKYSAFPCGSKYVMKARERQIPVSKGTKNADTAREPALVKNFLSYPLKLTSAPTRNIYKARPRLLSIYKMVLISAVKSEANASGAMTPNSVGPNRTPAIISPRTRG